ncbi:nucleotide-binding protein [uncultured Cetobacterium sp.]|uniref:nucleotide-binding protein n=1 Tax=uncultured Cetobacterium sp. TaxID=527638 RepID=UPI00261A4B6F|nr:nucleotide-binding protein [uncultured Cetobacterium sp.]
MQKINKEQVIIHFEKNSEIKKALLNCEFSVLKTEEFAYTNIWNSTKAYVYVYYFDIEDKKIIDKNLEFIKNKLQSEFDFGLNLSGVQYEIIVQTKMKLQNEVTMERNLPELKSISTRTKKKIFLVHGQDNEIKANVARFIEKFGIEAIILHEQVNEGRTIIEKIEKYTDVNYGIILYSACDVGKSKNEIDLKKRARQNVVFEHGYLIGKLGRERVIALNKDAVEVPSDISGIVYIPYDLNEGWKISVVKELKKSGFEIDSNILF